MRRKGSWPSGDDFRRRPTTGIAGRFPLEIVDPFPSFELCAEFSRIQEVGGIHGSDIWIGIDHDNDGDNGTADACACTNNRKQIPLEVIADHD